MQRLISKAISAGLRVRVIVTGSNDAASITSSSGEDTSVTEAGSVIPGDSSASGELTVYDVDYGEARFQTVTTTQKKGTYGSFTFSPSNEDPSKAAWTYTLDDGKADRLAAGAQATDTLTVTSADGTASYTITVNITGSNDAATITASENEDTSVTEAGGVANSVLGDAAASGQLTVQDVDNGEARFLAVAPSGLIGAYGNFTFNPPTGAWTYSLDEAKADGLILGQPATDALTVWSADSTASQTITVNITGANDAPYIVSNTTSPIAYGPVPTRAMTLSGFVLFNDVDLSDRHVTWIDHPGPGVLTVEQQADSTGNQTGRINWQLTLNYAPLLSLVVPNTITPITTTFALTPTDDNGGFATQVISHTETLIVGTNNAETLFGTIGDDIIVGLGAQGPRLGYLDDVLVSNSGNDLLIGGTNSLDAVDFSALTSGISANLALGSVTSGSPSASAVLINIDGIIGTNQDDIFSAAGFAGLNAFEGLAGNDRFTGNGQTLVSYRDATNAVSINLNAGTASINLAAGTAVGNDSIGLDTFISVNDFEGSNQNDVFDARNYVGRNNFEGRSGDDTIYGGLTKLLYGTATAGVTINLANGTATGDSSVGIDTFSGNSPA